MYLRRLTPERSEDFLLFCFPYAGASPYLYREWVDLISPFAGLFGANYWPLGQDIETQPAATQLALIAKAVAQEIAPLLDRPFALFGHSMGALLAYEVNRLLESSGSRQAEAVFFSSSRAPHRELPEPLHSLGEDDFRRRIIELEGIPPEIMSSESLLKQTLMRLRRDFIACENYRVFKFDPIRVPVKVFAGRDDNFREFASVEAWRLHAGSMYSLTSLLGNHFHIHNQRTQLINLIKNELGF